MSRPRWATVIGVVVVSFLLGCDSTREPDLVCGKRPIEGTLQPLELGNFWEYEVVWSDGRITSRHRNEVIERLVDRDRDGSPVYVMAKSRIDKPGATYYDLVASTSLGFQKVGYIRDADTVWVDLVTYPYPAEVGQVFGETPEYEVLSLNHETHLPVGTFLTIVYEHKEWWPDDFPAVRGYDQFAPGIGLVAHDTENLNSREGPFPTNQMRLTDYCLMQ